MYGDIWGEQNYYKLEAINENLIAFKEASLENDSNLYELELRQSQSFVVFTGCLNLIMMILLISYFLPKRKGLKKYE